MRISDWSSDVCSSDLAGARAGEGYGVGLSDVSGPGRRGTVVRRSAGIVGRDPRCGCARAEGRGNPRATRGNLPPEENGKASCRERVCPYLLDCVGVRSFKKKKENLDKARRRER